MSDYTLKAGADLTDHQYIIMRLSAANTCAVASHDQATSIVGILQNKPNTNEAAHIKDSGVGNVKAGAAISAAALVTTNGSGRAIAAASGDMVIGKALEAAGADGDIIEIIQQPPVKWNGAV